MKYSAPTEDGRKHYVVTLFRWGRTTERVVLAEDAADARYQVCRRRGPMEYVTTCKRATPEQVPPTGEDANE